MRHLGRHAGIVFISLVALLWASDAAARTERLRWTHADPSTVDNFRIYWGDQTGSYTSTRDVGVPSKDSTGAFFYDLVVADSLTIHVAVSAWNSGLESAVSNEIVRVGSTSGGGTTPPPPPPPSGAQAAIQGFALWNAQNDTLVDADFRDGDAIADSLRSCASIEIRTNDYLKVSGPGSIKKVFDGQDLGCGSGSRSENAYPYAWEDDNGVGSFSCAASLSQVGAHTLTVTPYDGDNCSGAQGAPASVSFTVNGSTSPPPPSSSELGAPGQPFLVQ